jgi:PBSX family phage terminase large subunit
MSAPVIDQRVIPTATLGVPRPRATTEDPIVSAGPSLSEKQFASLKQARAEINIWTGAIRSGKTVSSLLRWMMYVRRAPFGGRLVMIGRTKDTLNRNVFSVLQDPAIFGALAGEVRYTPGANVAYIFGRVIDIIGANDVRSESRLRGMTCAGAYVDEITLVPREFWTQLLGRKSIDEAKLFGTTNPDNPAHWLRKDFLLRANDPALGLRHWHFNIDDNPALSARRKAAYKAQFTGLFYKRFILGHWVAAEGAIFDMWDESRHVIRGELPLVERWLSIGVDYGTSNPFAAVSIGLSAERQPRLIVASEYRYDARQAHRSKSDQDYADDLVAWLDRHPVPGMPGRTGIRPEYIVIDPSARSFIVTMQQAGYSPAGADNTVLDGIRNVASLLSLDRLAVHESCGALIAEFPGYSWDDDEAQKGKDVPIKADDHSLDALRYGIHTTRALWRPFLLERA